MLFVGAARGMKSDWVQNILAEPRVEVHLKSDKFKGTAKVITKPEKIFHFLQIRLKNHPRMVAAMLRTDGISKKTAQEELLKYAEEIVIVAIHPILFDSKTPPRNHD